MNKCKTSASSSVQGEEPTPCVKLQCSRDAAEHEEEELGDLEITKSPSDPKKYRYVELRNGLRVLLVSDLNRSDGVSCDGPEDTDTDLEESEEDDEDYSGQSSEAGGDSVDSSREHKTGKTGSSEKQSAAALCVAVGSFSDPDELPGLAHFLEHMVFMGSKKYPAENGFDAFLKKHGGSDNASTDCERTIFQFDVQRKYFKEALDRWAQFFICPLMIQDAVDREVEAVDSEYQLARPSDSQRKEMLFGSLAKPNHVMSKFCWGNAQTLKHEPKEKGINTYNRLREFWKRYYSAHFMTLVVQSREKLDTLEEWVREIFSKIPNNGQSQPDFSHLKDPFDTPAFNKMYRVVPVRKVHALNITWALPPQAVHYRVKPLHYLSWLIGHEGAGGILSQLRKRCWAVALSGGNSETGFDQNTTYSIFSVSINLTSKGFQNVFEVADLVFQYMKMMQVMGPQERIYSEIQKIEANEFHFQEQSDPIEFVENVCENMQLYPKEDFLTGDQLMFEYDPKVISAALALMTPDKANFILLSPEHDNQWDCKEKWFGAQYRVEDIPQKWRSRWAEDFEANSDLHLPFENKFIATDFALKTSDCSDTVFPVRVLDTKRGSLWFKKDNKFKIPKAYVRLYLLTPIIQQSPANLVLFDIFVNILAHNLAEPAYDADVAQLEYKLVAGEHGLIIRVKGFNHKLPLLLQLIVDYLADFSTSLNVFTMFVEQLKKSYFNVLINPERLGKDVRLLILEHCRWSMMQKYEALMEGLSVDDLMNFVKSLKSELYVEGLVQGNCTSAESKEFLEYLINKLQFSPLTVEAPVLFRVVELPGKHHICKVRSLNKGDANSEVTVYFQSGRKNLWEHTLMELLVMHMEEPCFDFLRTKETLGYQVYPLCRNTSGTLGFSITVETQATKFSTDFVESKVEEFLVSFGEKLMNLSDEAFEMQVTALIKLKECEDTHLGEEVDRNWFEVVTQQYVFDRLSKEIEALKRITKADLLNWYMEHRQSNSKRLSIHVVGFGEAEGDKPEADESSCPSTTQLGEKASTISAYGEVNKLTFLQPSSLLSDITMIDNIRQFTASLTLYPYHKILK